eukprot:CAMPEP_0115324298 /NCGR_PEP_ID=MMETSP0270-20121206/82405_1 /TAXON_ID=71861 /ORGANISM="Scrippsiella trochoidea, Strain CCMP3099" /LENGTH=122 /DNA_ID=CAMNT_0002744409 /DNA_START=46 /DNA_END=411 /DNA_ORIENTATION=+
MSLWAALISWRSSRSPWAELALTLGHTLPHLDVRAHTLTPHLLQRLTESLHVLPKRATHRQASSLRALGPLAEGLHLARQRICKLPRLPGLAVHVGLELCTDGRNARLDFGVEEAFVALRHL